MWLTSEAILTLISRFVEINAKPKTLNYKITGFFMKAFQPK